MSFANKVREFFYTKGPARMLRVLTRRLFLVYIFAQFFLIFGTPYIGNDFNYDVKAGKLKFAQLVTDPAVIKEQLRPKTEKKYSGKMIKSRYSICYVHGFSASRKDLEPVVSRVANQLDANLFFTRLSGHGYKHPDILKKVTAQNWIQDTIECLEVAARTGDKVVLMGTSLGAALASLVAINTNYKIHSLILASPYFGINDPKADLLAGYLGGYIADIYFKGYRSFKPINPEQGEYWTTTYPASILKQVMIVNMAIRQSDFARLNMPVFIAYSTKDEVIDIGKILAKYEDIQTQKRLDKDPTYLSHVLAGDIVNPRGNAQLQKNIYSFIKANY